MNKRILLLGITLALTQNSMHSALTTAAGTIGKIAPIGLSGAGTASKVAPSLSGSTTQTAVSMPRIKLNPTQIETLTKDLSGMGGKQYLPQIQEIWETNPEIMYNAQQAIQNADLNARRQYINQIINLAKQLSSQKSTTFSIQDAITRNPQLEKLIDTELSDNLLNISKNLEKVAYQSQIPTKFHLLRSDFDFLTHSIREVITNTELTPQEAASKIGELINKSFNATQETSNIIKLAEKTASHAEDVTVRKALNQTKELFETTKELLKKTQSILQKTAPVQSKQATYSELQNFVESISKPSESSMIPTGPSSVEPTISGEIGNLIPVPTEIKPFFESQIKSITNHARQFAGNMKQLLQKDIPNLGLSTDEIKVFERERIKISNEIKTLSNILNKIASFSNNPNAINEFKISKGQLSVVVTEITNSLAKIREKTKTLLTSEKESALTTLHAIVTEVSAIDSDANTTLLVLEEAHANKEALVQIKQQLDLGAFVGKTQTDLAVVQQTAQTLAHILTSNEALLKTDKAPASMLEVFTSKIAKYLTTFEELTTITNIEQLGALETKLQEQEKELISTLNSLSSKLEWLPTSTAKNEALDAFRKLKSEFLANKKSIDDIFAKAKSIQETHTFVNIRKNELEMGMLTIIDKSKALRASITKTIPADKLTSEQTQALSRLSQDIQEELSALKQIKNAKTPFELDFLTKEFFKVKDISYLSKKPSSLVPYGPSDMTMYIPKVEERFEETFAETLKLFGLKMILGLTATGIVTWLVQKANEEEEKPDSSKKEFGTTKVIQKTPEEFMKAANQILEEIKNLDKVPTANLDTVIHRLEMDMDMISFKNFTKEARLFWYRFSEAISTAISDAAIKFNQYRLRKLEEFKNYVNETIMPLFYSNDTTENASTENDASTEKEDESYNKMMQYLKGINVYRQMPH